MRLFTREEKIPLVSWDSICSDKLHKGLGLRRVHHMNMALLMKLGWDFITKIDSDIPVDLGPVSRNP